MELLKPDRFLLQSDSTQNSSTSTFYECKNNETRKICDCKTPEMCDGDISFCKLFNCTKAASCKCEFTRADPQLYYVTDKGNTLNPMILTFETCLIDKRVSRRHILEKEEANFKKGDLVMNFNDPVMTFSGLGTVILKTSDYEIVMSIPADLQIILPFELLRYRTTLHVTFLHVNGTIVKGDIQLGGKIFAHYIGVYYV